MRSAAADRGDHVEPGAGRERRVETAPLPVDVRVDVWPQRWAFGDETIAEPGPLRLELVDRAEDRRRLELEAARQSGEERCQRPGKADVGHSLIDDRDVD